MRRARSDEEKRERREAILDTALAMYAEQPSFAAFTMAALGERAGVAKGTLYLYFRTKEELFLALAERFLAEWFAEVEGRLARAAEAWTAERAAAALLESLRGREVLARLLSILGTILEHNVEFEAALRFKRELHARAFATGRLLEARLPWLVPGQGARLLLYLHALVVGLWQMAEPSPVVARIMAAPELEPARIDFERDLAVTLGAMLRGLETAAP